MYHLWSDSEILSTADFITLLNQLLTASAVTTIQSVMENNDQPCSSSSLGLCPRTPTRTPVSAKNRSQLVSMQSPSKRCKHLNDTLDEDTEKHKKGDQLLYKIKIQGDMYKKVRDV